MPSGLWREATSLFHSPKSNTVARSDVAHGDLAERVRSRSAPRACRHPPHRQARRAACARRRSARRSSCRRRPRRRPPPGGRRRAPRAACAGTAPRSSQPGSRVGEDHRADVLLGQPDHVAVEADHVAAVVNDGNAVRRVDHQPHAVRRVLADGDLRLAPREQRVLRDVALAVRQRSFRELHRDVLQHVVDAAPRRRPRAATG